MSWLPAKKIEVPDKFFKKSCPAIEPKSNLGLTDFPLKLIDSEKVVIKLTEENCENIIEAESKHSDLLPAKYEGSIESLKWFVVQIINSISQLKIRWTQSMGMYI